MKADGNQSVESGTLIKAAAADCDMATARLEIDPRELALIVRGRIAALKFPTLEREREAAACIRSRSRHIDELISAGVSLPKIVAELGIMEELCRELTAPIPIPSFQDQITSAMHIFRNLSWETAEVEALRPFFKHGDRLTDIAISSVKLGGREISRRQVREDMRNRYWSHAALDQYERNESMALRNEAAREEMRERGGTVRMIYSDGGMNRKAIQQ